LGCSGSARTGIELPRRAAQRFADHLNGVLNSTVSDSRLSLIPLPADPGAFELTRLVDGDSAPLDLHGTTVRLFVRQVIVVKDGHCSTESYGYRLLGSTRIRPRNRDGISSMIVRGRPRSLAWLALTLCGWVVVLGLVQPAPAAASTRHKRPVCVVYRCRTLSADVQVRVYQATSRHPGRESHESTYARWLPSSRVTALGDNGTVFEGAVLKGLAVSGRFVAYTLGLAAERYQGTGFTEGVERLNAQTGRRESIPPDGEKGGGFGEKSPGVTDIVATPAGSIAWIDDGSFQNPIGPLSATSLLPLGSKAVLELPPSSKTPTALAVSSAIAPQSLAAIPGHLYWTEGGTARSTSIS
jgi:hypothetical protein